MDSTKWIMIACAALTAVLTAAFFIQYFRISKRINQLAKPMLDDALNRMKNAPDDNSPEESADVRVIAKRTYVWGHHHAHTVYYAAFETADRRRFELMIPADAFGLLTEGDEGRLTFKGSRFVSLSRR